MPEQALRAARSVIEYAPGLLLVLVLATVARSVTPMFPAAISEITLGVVFGLAVGNLRKVDRRLVPGIRFSVARLLRLGIVFLGARLNFGDVLSTGAGALLIVVVSMGLALSLTLLLSRALAIPPRLALLIAVGTAVCGNSAIVATAPVIEAEDRDVSFAVATITLFGIAAVLLYPLIGHLLNLSDNVYGHWVGVAVNDTSQVTAAGFAYSDVAGATATIVKLTRNTLMGPLIVAIGLLYVRSGAAQSKGNVEHASRLGFLRLVPLFVIGFLTLAVANSVGLVPSAVGVTLSEAAKFLILLALVGVGLSTDLRQMSAVGLRPLYLGLGVAAFLAAFSLTLVTHLVRS